MEIRDSGKSNFDQGIVRERSGICFPKFGGNPDKIDNLYIKIEKQVDLQMITQE